ncbi:hypothetical protein BH10PSE11_BH10PSE11_08410 [soil metagenome]
MPRPRERVCLQDGLKLDLNNLAKHKFIRRGAATVPVGIRWTHAHWGEVARGVIYADMSGEYFGQLSIRLEEEAAQKVSLIAKPRNFGGRQWYFVCPVTGRAASVLWRPGGATRFCSRQTWGRQVAYQSQFSGRDGRAHLGQSKIKSRLIGELDPDDWDLPPKPKGMRWATYNRHTEKFDGYGDILDSGIVDLVAKLGSL